MTPVFLFAHAVMVLGFAAAPTIPDIPLRAIDPTIIPTTSSDERFSPRVEILPMFFTCSPYV